MLGSIESFDTVVRALANASGAIVVSVGYRLAPEAPFPAGLEDCLCAVRWLAANAAELGADPDRLAIAGDSAGGNLATVVARRLRGEVELRMQALIYPVTDAGCNTASYGEFGERPRPHRRLDAALLEPLPRRRRRPRPRRVAAARGRPGRLAARLRAHRRLRPAARRGRGLRAKRCATPACEAELAATTARSTASGAGWRPRSSRGPRSTRSPARCAPGSPERNRRSGLGRSGQPARRYRARHGCHTDHRHVPLLAPVRRHGRGLASASC